MKTKFHPMLYSTPMVQGILEGRKTKTRRTKGLEKVNLNPSVWKLLTSFDKPDDKETAFYIRNERLFVQFTNGYKNLDIKCPYNVGDILWVRETFCEPNLFDGYEEDFYFKADNIDRSRSEYRHIANVKWRPSLFMPKQACRIFLKLKSIRVERLQDISEEDAIAEGAKDSLKHTDLKVMTDLKDWVIPSPFLQHQFGFLSIWCTINGCDNWIQNPFVWVYEFKRIEKPNDFI